MQMDCYDRNYSCRGKFLWLLISALLTLSSTQLRFLVGGSRVSILPGDRKVNREVKVVTRIRIGSRPPRCENKCASCTHCEAVQIPAIPQDKGRKIRYSSLSSLPYREDSSNYKPMSWKCKCGNVLINP